MSLYVKRLQNCGPSKFAVKKILKNDVGAFPRLNLYCSKTLLSGRPGFESRTLQTLKLCSFAAPCSTRSYTTSIESPITPLLEPEDQDPGSSFKILYFNLNIHHFAS